MGGEQRAGMVVRQVLDVSGGTLLEKDDWLTGRGWSWRW